ncbi:MAG: hypothetical protein EOO03_17645 [Chitinophagaceae bacterium]|nr:MAG: hypothetical protein EOO03_17645 [Chitinophagaceae bacterium]
MARTASDLKGDGVYTDKLPTYRALIPSVQHSTFSKCTNHIERKHLTVRCHVKRLNRRTLGFSRSVSMLQAVMKIYFWANDKCQSNRH